MIRVGQQPLPLALWGVRRNTISGASYHTTRVGKRAGDMIENEIEALSGAVGGKQKK